jgi:hypothetical protein
LRFKLPRTLYLQGQAWLGLKEREAARACWSEARDEAEAIGSRWMLWQILAALAQVECDPVQATELRRQAQAVVESISSHIRDLELRASFFNLPQVQMTMHRY